MSYEGPRGARREELDAVVSLVSGTFSGPHDLINFGALLFAPENAENLRIMLHEGVPVSHVGLKRFEVDMCGCRLDIACVGGVCTRPERHRGKGLASRVLADAWERLRESRVDFVMISGDRGLYWRAGAARCSPTLQFVVPPAADKAAPVSAKIEAGELNGTADALLKIYEREPVRFKRTAEQLHRACEPRPEIKERAILVLWEEAYLLGWRAQAENGTTYIKVQEYAGDRVRICKEAAGLAGELGAALHFDVPAWDETMAEGLATAGTKREVSNYPETTIKVLALDRLMEKTRPIWAAKINEEAAGRLSFRQDGDTAEISLGEATLRLGGQEPGELVFGTAEARAWASDKAALQDVLEKIFPLPGPRYGMNYL